MENRRLPYLLIAPAATIFALLFVAPFVHFFLISFWTVRSYRLRPDLSLASYARVGRDYVDIALFTVVLALVVALLTTLAGFLYAYIIRFRAGRFGPLLLFLALVTLFGGYLMKIYAWKTILGNEGVLNSALMSLGLIDQPFTALLYSPAAVVVTLVHFLVPFAILPIYGSLRGISDIEIEAARDLGARRLQILTGILVPRCRAGLTAAFIFCFLIAAGDYVTPLLVGGTITMLGNVIATKFGAGFDWPLGSAMSFVILAAAVVVVTVTHATLSLWRPR
ncbi:MAG: ABC transporter permease [Rhodospirillaceae bacterium]|nr:ABC transporter permease [Rhodospirillaceae bacterium]